MKGARMCKIFYCDARGDRFCCRDCNGFDVCLNHCLNDPARCRLEDTGPDGTKTMKPFVVCRDQRKQADGKGARGSTTESS